MRQAAIEFTICSMIAAFCLGGITALGYVAAIHAAWSFLVLLRA
jgi:hypothetical protein